MGPLMFYLLLLTLSTPLISVLPHQQVSSSFLLQFCFCALVPLVLVLLSSWACVTYANTLHACRDVLAVGAQSAGVYAR